MIEGFMSLEIHEGEYDRIFIFGWAIPLNECSVTNMSNSSGIYRAFGGIGA